MTLPFVDRPHEVLHGPIDVGTEQRWMVRLDGQRAVVAQLAPDLARDESIRRRYVRDQERVIELGSHAVVETLALGPQPDPRDPAATPPWRMRLSPDADDLTSILGRAPLGMEEFTSVFSGLADAVHSVHRAGAVLRDLRPGQVLRTREGSVVLCDIGLARVDVLSSHTASSLLLQGSPYAAPEQLFRTTVDQRSDLYSLGALMWHALTGSLPFDDGPALLRERPPLPELRSLRADATAELSQLLPRLLDADPHARPPSVSEVLWVLRGGAALMLSDTSVTCQHCDATLRVGQRLCLACGRVAVRFDHVSEHERGWGLDLRALSEDAAPLEWLQTFLTDVSQHPMRPPEFIIGNVHLYDEEEKIGRIRLPARLYSGLSRKAALALCETMKEHGLKVSTVSPEETRRAGIQLGIVTLVVTAISVAVASAGYSVAWPLVPGAFLFAWMLIRFNNRLMERRSPGAFRLRDAPVALPASDPYVARLSALLDSKPPADVRGIVADLALLVQRLVDHRASLHGRGTAELEVVTAPLDPLVAAVERNIRRAITLSEEIGELDEGAMVRALAASEARRDPAHAREPLLAGLDRLRGLEDQRAQVLHRLLEVQALLQRTVEMGLTVQDPVAQHERDMQRALASLAPE